MSLPTATHLIHAAELAGRHVSEMFGAEIPALIESATEIYRAPQFMAYAEGN